GEAFESPPARSQSNICGCEEQMERSGKIDEALESKAAIFAGNAFAAVLCTDTNAALTLVVERRYTTSIGKCSGVRRNSIAFIRRKGNSFYLVHNVRRGEKVRQIHLARLGERARITDEVVRTVSKKHPFVELNWRALREQVNSQLDLADPNAPA